MATARTHCPECNSRSVIDLVDVLVHGEVDFFWCGACRAMWHLPKGQDWPPSMLPEPSAPKPPVELGSSPAAAQPARDRRPPGVRPHRSTRPPATPQR
jgi:hypothetical protein